MTIQPYGGSVYGFLKPSFVRFANKNPAYATIDNMSIKTMDLPYRQSFTTSHGVSNAVQAIYVNLSTTVNGQHYTGWGECRSDGYYGNNTHSLLQFLNQFRKSHVWRHAAVFDLHSWQSKIQALQENRQRRHLQEPSNKPAWSALEMAFLDLQGHLTHQPLYQLLEANPLRHTQYESAYTIDISANKTALKEKIKYAIDHHYSLLKVKVGSPEDIQTLTTIRQEVPSTFRIIVDANAGWTLQKALVLIPKMKSLGVELIEEPFARDVSIEDRITIHQAAKEAGIPIFADESVHTQTDIANTSRYVDGINIKLIKTGGLMEACRMIIEARARHMKVMLGCYVESSLSITAMAHLAPLADYLDLDGALLLQDDPFQGIHWKGNRFSLPNETGIGAHIKT